MELDASIILPALFFTILAVVLAAKFIPKKQPEEKKKRIKVGNGDDIPPARALTPAVAVVDVPKVEIPPPVIVPKVEVPPQVVDAEVIIEPVTVAPVVEEINVVEEETVKEPEMIPDVQAVPEPVPESVVEPEPVPEPIPEPEPIPVIVEEPILDLIAESVVKEVPVREHTPEPAREPNPKPAREPTPDAIFVTEPEDLESNAEEVHFTPGMKISKLEKMMTKEEMEEEQSAAE